MISPSSLTSPSPKHQHSESSNAFTITRLSVSGSLFLAVLAAIPVIFSWISSAANLSSQVTLGGTGLLIVVGVALETFKQLESSVVSRSYASPRERRRGR